MKRCQNVRSKLQNLTKHESLFQIHKEKDLGAEKYLVPSKLSRGVSLEVELGDGKCLPDALS